MADFGETVSDWFSKNFYELKLALDPQFLFKRHEISNPEFSVTSDKVIVRHEAPEQTVSIRGSIGESNLALEEIVVESESGVGKSIYSYDQDAVVFGNLRFPSSCIYTREDSEQGNAERRYSFTTKVSDEDSPPEWTDRFTPTLPLVEVTDDRVEGASIKYTTITSIPDIETARLLKQSDFLRIAFSEAAEQAFKSRQDVNAQEPKDE